MTTIVLSWLASNWLLVAGVLALGFAAFNPLAFWKAKAWILAGAIALWGWSGHAAHDALQLQAAKDRAHAAQAIADAQANARAAEHKHTQELASIAAQYEKDKADAEAAADRLADDLRAGNRRLRSLWQGCQATGRLSGAAASAAEPDAEDRLREESAGRIVGAVRACQSQRDALINVIEADRRVK